MILTLKFRLKDKHAADLNRQARSVNFVWNYCNEGQQRAARAHRKWLSAFDLQRLTAGSSVDMNLHAQTIQKVCQQYEQSRRQNKKAWLKFRGRKSLGWVPFGKNNIRFDGSTFTFRGISYHPMHLRNIPAGTVLREGSFNQDTKGHWYINLPVEMPLLEPAAQSAIGIDLGLRDLATISTGEKIAAPKHYRRLEERFGKAQRANKKRLARNIAAKVANARKDHLHKASARLALAHNVIVVGDVSSSKLARTRMAKSVLDASWSTLRRHLSYKALRHGGTYIEVNEQYTSQVCSQCGALPDGRPKGIADIGIREWTCGDCGATHDRDVNAARNILARGLASLAEGALI